jgi:hypothetical protein
MEKEGKCHSATPEIVGMSALSDELSDELFLNL